MNAFDCPNSRVTAAESRPAGCEASRYAPAPRKRRSFADDSPETRYQNSQLAIAAQRRIREQMPQTRVKVTGGHFAGRTGVLLRKRGDCVFVRLDNGMEIHPRIKFVEVIA